MLCATLIASCTEFEDTSSRGSIAGSVIDKSTGETIPTVNVELTPTGAKKVTGMNGTFEFNNVKTGEYTITTNKEGYEPGSTTITVSSGEVAECYILMERIPAVITPNKDELDFGSNYSTNTQSFNIVNNHHETLHWEIINNCGWITSVSPMQGTLAHSKTGTIVVKIDRDQLPDGDNVAVLVLSTEGEGSVDITVKAYGQAKKLATLNTLEVSNVSATKATFSGEIINAGYPEYTERGFVYSEEPMPTVEKTIHKLSTTLTSDKKFSYPAVGLICGKTYYVRAYAVNEMGTAYSSNQVSFKTVSTAGEVKMVKFDSKNLSDCSIIAYAEIVSEGDPPYEERGFVYSHTNTNPNINDEHIPVDGKSKGEFSAKFTHLLLETTYFVRAYIKTGDAKVIYSDCKSFNTNTTAGKVTLEKIDNADLKNHKTVAYAEITSNGDPAYTECGVVYSNTNPLPTILHSKAKAETVNADGSYSVELADLEREATYYVRAYIKGVWGVVYSAAQTFNTNEKLAEVETLSPKNIDEVSLSAILCGNIKSVGNPAYTERGFVYSTKYDTPTIDDAIILADGIGTGGFEARIVLQTKEKTAIRAYAKNSKGVAYGETCYIFRPAYIELPTYGIAVQPTDITSGDINWIEANRLCEDSTLDGLDDWRLPTLDEASVLYNNDNKIGNFSYYYNHYYYCYWTSTIYDDTTYTNYYYAVCMYDGNVSCGDRATSSYKRARCVRTLTK